MESYSFSLDKKAKTTGADKYQCKTIEKFNFYVPQPISRDSEEPKGKLTVEISKKGGEYELKLEKKAKSTGGDKFSCKEFNVYVPQEISREKASVCETLFFTIN